MQGTDQQVLEAALRWTREGHRYALVTVARTWGSAPRPAGAMMVLRSDGQVQGSVSGGCIETDLIERMAQGRLHGALPFVLTYGVTQEEAQRFGLPCGGTMELVIEPCPDAASLAALSARLAQGQLALRTVRVGHAEVTLGSGSVRDGVTWDGKTLVTPHGPAWRLLLVGAR